MKRLIRASGWYVRRTAGLPIGVGLFTDLRLFGVHPKCVLDIGAHHGQTALAYVCAFPDCRIFAFEPSGHNFMVLQHATGGHPSIIAVNAAVSDQAGRLYMRHHSETSQGHSITSVIGSDTEPVDAITIDQFCADRKVLPDLIKIDVEGHEQQVLAGARRMLTLTKAVVVEATLNPSNRRHTQLSDLMSRLTPLGFRIVALHDQNLWETTGQLEFFNALFVKH